MPKVFALCKPKVIQLLPVPGNIGKFWGDKGGRTVFYAVAVNYLYRDRVMVRIRVRRPDSSGNLLPPQNFPMFPWDWE